MISIRKLAAVDMAWLGGPVILAEYGLGIFLPLLLGVLSIRAGLRDPAGSAWETILAIWLFSIAANYVPLFIYAVLIAKAETIEEEGQPEIAHAKKYGLQQIVILVPLLVVLLALIQERRARSPMK
jgi:hypothetical protein